MIEVMTSFSKLFLIAATKVISREESNISVNSCCPGIDVVHIRWLFLCSYHDILDVKDTVQLI
jgi:hypothetical protein